MYCSNIFNRYRNTSFSFTLNLRSHIHSEQNGDALVGAAAVGAVFDAVDWGKAAFGQPKDHAYGVLLRLPFQGVAACRATDAFYKTCLI